MEAFVLSGELYKDNRYQKDCLITKRKRYKLLNFENQQRLHSQIANISAHPPTTSSPQATSSLGPTSISLTLTAHPVAPPPPPHHHNNPDPSKLLSQSVIVECDSRGEERWAAENSVQQRQLAINQANPDLVQVDNKMKQSN